MAFKPGNPKPQNSGMQPGTTTKKVQARENAQADRLKELARLCREHDGKDVETIFKDMNYNPLIHSIMLAMDNTIQPSVQQKVIESLTKKLYPDLKSVEVTGTQTNRIEIVLGDGSSAGMFSAFAQPSQLSHDSIEPIDATVIETIEVNDGADDEQ